MPGTVVMLVDVEQTEPRAEDKQSEGGYGHPTPPTPEEITVLHGLSIPRMYWSKGGAILGPGAVARK
jgi:hypothetical protein